ncbi:hypothetical protein F2P45_19510 [Massilia sp. CCM 8733]|uniref:DUF4124 domain-containing protein n=1 Tax=Massilia mucilaginosa TaxID=2609282 RepID=A0ABX0NX09_9BURK|nr:DUF4124 domain-containing protein [Massilia mucilaginosa]NHZ91185.1 hypothetical protein [Massilia mucilaginosa]
MQPRSLYLALILASLCTGAHAGLNKCKGPNGHPVYQNAPCPPPASAYAKKMPTLAERNALSRQQKLEEQQRYPDERPGANWDPGRKPAASLPPYQPAQVAAAPAAPAVPGKAAAGAPSKSAAPQKAGQETVRPDAALARAKSRSSQCSHARQQLGTLQDGVGVHTVDSKGQRTHVTDARRQSLLPEARRRVQEACG